MTKAAAIILAIAAIVFLSLLGWLLSRMGKSEIPHSKRAGSGGGFWTIGGDGGSGDGSGGGGADGGGA